MIELLTVVTIIGVTAAYAVPSLKQMAFLKSAGYNDTVKATIDYARKIAVAQRRHVCVNVAATSVTVTIDRGLPSSHTNGTCPSTLLLPSGVNSITAPGAVTVSPTVSIDFDAEGRPVTGAPATITLTDSSAGQTSTLTIESESGYVH
jgi:MSHA pilin protein MshC